MFYFGDDPCRGKLILWYSGVPYCTLVEQLLLTKMIGFERGTDVLLGRILHSI
jgi:hypothetical protein